MASAAAAQENCIAPFGPVIPDGASVSEAEILSVREQVTAFLRDSASYENCLAVSLRQLQDEARRDNEPVDQRLQSSITARIDASKERQQVVGGAFNIAVRTFNARMAAPPEGGADAAPGE